jgi:hypothetical protein
LSLADQPNSGRPSTCRTDENMARIRELILEDRQNLFPMVKLLISRCTYKFWNVCMTKLGENAPKCGRVGSGGFTTTTRQRTKPWVWNNF